MVTLENHPRHREKVLARKTSDDLIVLNLNTGQYYALDEVGWSVWELCDGTRSVSDVISAICDEYDAPAETIKTDVLKVLGDLIDEELLEDGQAVEGAGKSAFTV